MILIRMRVMSGNCSFNFVMKAKKEMRLEQQKRWAEVIAFQGERSLMHLNEKMMERCQGN